MDDIQFDLKDWTNSSKQFKQSITSYRKHFKELLTKVVPETPPYPILTAKWSENQKKTLQHFQTLGCRISEGLSVRGSCQISGESGSGKSLVLRQVRHILHTHDIPCAFVTICGVLAHYHHYQTLHSLLGLTKKQQHHTWFTLYKKGYVTRGNSLETLRRIKFLFLDEFTQVSATCLAYIDFVLRSVRRVDEDFGGVYVCYVGDPYQVRSIGGSLLYSHKVVDEASAFAQRGVDLYRKANSLFYLESSRRQAADVEFLSLLRCIRAKTVSEKQVELLRTRLACNQPDEELALFDDALLICPRNKTIRRYNYNRLLEHSRNIITIKPQTTAPRYIKEDRTLKLALGVKVALTVNYCIRLGLVNGREGILRGVKFNKTVKPNQPAILFVEFAGVYCEGVEFGYVPIFLYSESIFIQNADKPSQIAQFPLTLVYGLTVYKVQGITCERAQIYLDKREIYEGQSYSQLSRVQKLEDLILLDKNIQLARFTDNSFFRGHRDEQLEAKRLGIYDCIYNASTDIPGEIINTN